RRGPRRARRSDARSRKWKDAPAAAGGADVAAPALTPNPAARRPRQPPAPRPPRISHVPTAVAGANGDDSADADGVVGRVGRARLLGLSDDGCRRLGARWPIQPQMPRRALGESFAAHAVAIGVFRLVVDRRA